MMTHAIEANELPLSNKLSNSCRLQTANFVTRQTVIIYNGKSCEKNLQSAG